LEVGVSLTRGVKYVNHRIETEGLPVQKFNLENFSAHFASHITLPERVSLELGKACKTPLKEINLEAGNAVEDMVRRKVGNDVNDYLHLDSLRSQLTEKLEILDSAVEKESDGIKTLDLEVLDRYSRLASEIRNCIIDLNKIRQSRKLINIVIRSLIEKYTFNIIRHLIREYDHVKDEMIAAGVDEVLAVKVNQQLKLQAADIIATTAKSAVEDVTRTYKLV
jgi:hypothetical protein